MAGTVRATGAVFGRSPQLLLPCGPHLPSPVLSPQTSSQPPSASAHTSPRITAPPRDSQPAWATGTAPGTQRGKLTHGATESLTLASSLLLSREELGMKPRARSVNPEGVSNKIRTTLSDVCIALEIVHSSSSTLTPSELPYLTALTATSLPSPQARCPSLRDSNRPGCYSLLCL